MSLHFVRLRGLIVARDAGVRKNNSHAIINPEMVKWLAKKYYKQHCHIVVYTSISRKSTHSLWNRVARQVEIVLSLREGTITPSNWVILLDQEDLGADKMFCVDCRRYLALARRQLSDSAIPNRIYFHDYEPLTHMEEAGGILVPCQEFRPSRIRRFHDVDSRINHSRN